jgi:hypothetical protein
LAFLKGEAAMRSDEATVEALRRCFEFKTKDSEHILHHANALFGAIARFTEADGVGLPTDRDSLHIAHELLAICRHVQEAVDAANG